MHLAIFLFPILLISVSSVEFREDIPPYVLDGFKHIKAKAIVEVSIYVFKFEIHTVSFLGRRAIRQRRITICYSTEALPHVS